jgi:hypothetical protein
LTFRLAAIPEYCAAATATGSLEECLAVASTVIQSNLAPSFAAAYYQSSNQSSWKLMVGFEGFLKTINYQLEKLREVFKIGNLENIDQKEYKPHEGPFADVFNKISSVPYILRAGLPINKIYGPDCTINAESLASDILLDLGCGRIWAGFETISDNRWNGLCKAIESLRGHVALDKAPDDFKQHHDVFGTEHPEWKMIHRVKAALDPNNVFSPGRLPGRI